MKNPQEYINNFSLFLTYNKEKCLFVERLRKRGFTTKQIADILFELDGICLKCFDNDKDCHCWKDE